MRNSIFIPLFLAISLGACHNDEIRSPELGNFDDWAVSVASNQIDKAVDAYEGAVTIVHTKHEYVLLKAGSDAKSTHQTYALVPAKAEVPQLAPIHLESAQVIRDGEGNVIVQDLKEPRAWRFTVKSANPVVGLNPDVEVTDIALSASVTTTLLPQNTEAILEMVTVFANRARELGLEPYAALQARDNQGEQTFERILCDCRTSQPGPDDCQAGGPGASACSLGDNGRNCAVSCATATACCKLD